MKLPTFLASILLAPILGGGLVVIATEGTQLSTIDAAVNNPDPCEYCTRHAGLPQTVQYIAIEIDPGNKLIPLPGQPPVVGPTLDPSEVLAKLHAKQTAGFQIEQRKTGSSSNCVEFRNNKELLFDFKFEGGNVPKEIYGNPWNSARKRELKKGVVRVYTVIASLKFPDGSEKCENTGGDFTLKIKAVVTYKILPKPADNPDNDGGSGGSGGPPGDPGIPDPGNTGGGAYLDTDCDGLFDSVEDLIGTNKTNSDTDSDGIDDHYEVTQGLNPTSPDISTTDSDGDGITLAKEFEYGSNPFNPDGDTPGFNTVGDGLPDIWEIQNGTDPQADDANNESFAGRNGATNFMAYINRANLVDADGDGLPKYAETLWNTNDDDTDTDLDGIIDSREIAYKMPPNISSLSDTNAVNDLDKDGLSDLFEDTEAHGSSTATLSPVDPDSDWDGLPDKWELDTAYYDPLTLQNQLIFWLRMDTRKYEIGNKLRLFNHAYCYNDSIRSDAYCRGNMSLSYDETLNKDVITASGGNMAFVTVPSSNNLLSTSENLTIGCRFNLSTNTCTPVQRILYQDGVIDIKRLANGNIQVLTTNQAGVISTNESQISIPANQWSHLSFILTRLSNNDQRLSLYINGASAMVITIQGGFRQGLWPLHLGSTRSVPNYTPSGKFSDFRIYNAALSPSDLLLWADLSNPDREELKDPDNDSVNNLTEFKAGSNPYEVDSDFDGLSDFNEINGPSPSLPYLPNSDGDKLSDFDEVTVYFSNPLLSDTDGDKLLDSEENEMSYIRSNGTYGHPSPILSDTDNDGLNDFFEVRYQRNPLIPDPADIDNDGVNNAQEIINGTDPRFPPGVDISTDTDGDGLTDYEEVNDYGTNPNSAYSIPGESAGSGITDFDRVTFGLIGPKGNINSDSSNAWNADKDGDGINNLNEVKVATDPWTKSNMTARLVRAQALTEIKEITAEEAKTHGTKLEWLTTSVSVYVPDNAQVVLHDSSQADGNWIVLNDLELSGTKYNGDTTSANIGIEEEGQSSSSKFRGYDENIEPGWKHVKESPRTAYTGVSKMDVSSFINSLERDANGMVNILVKATAEQPVKALEKAPEGLPDFFPDLNYRPWNAGYGGGGSGLGGGPDSGWSPWVDIFSSEEEKEEEVQEDETLRPFPVYGSTSVKINIIATDIDVRSAGKTGPYTRETKEDQTASFLTPADPTIAPTDVSKSASVLIHPTGVIGGQRRISWSSNLLLLHNGQYLQPTDGHYDFPETLGKVELKVFSNINSSGGGTISLIGLDDQGASFGGDSVALTDTTIDLTVFPDEAMYFPADEDARDVLFLARALVDDETDGLHLEDLGDGSILGVRVKKGINGQWQDDADITTLKGIASFKPEFDPSIDKDGLQIFIKVYVKQFNAPTGSLLPSFNYGNVAKTLGEASSAVTNSNSSLICFSEKVEISPGTPTSVDFVTDPVDSKYPADGESTMKIVATPRDAYGNKLRLGASAMWSMTGYGAVDSYTTEINEQGEVEINLTSKEKRTDDFYQTAILSAPGATSNFEKSIGNLKMTGTLTGSSTNVIIGGNQPVEITAHFSAEQNVDLKNLKVLWHCSNGTFIQESEGLDASGNAKITVTGNGANVGNGVVYAQCGTASATINLTFVADPSTVSFKLLNPLLSGNTNRTEVLVNGKPGAIVSVGFANLESPSDQFSKHSQYFALDGLNSSQEITLNVDGRASFYLRKTGELPNNIAYTQSLLTGVARWTPPGSSEVQIIKVTPGRVVSAIEKIGTGLKDYALGFLWGGSSTLAGAAGELTLGLIPGYGALGDARDLLKEISRGIIPGGDDFDGRIFALAAVSLVTEIIPFLGSGVSAATGVSKIILGAIRNLMTPITALVAYGTEIKQFLQYVSQSIGYYIYTFNFERLDLFLKDNGIKELVLYLLGELNSTAYYKPIIDQDGNECYLVASGTTFTKVIKSLQKIAKSGDGMFSIGRAAKELKVGSAQKAFLDVLTDIAEQSPDAARKILKTFEGNSMPRKVLDAIDSGNIADVKNLFVNMAIVFSKTSVDEKTMRKILNNNSIFDDTLVVSANASTMTLGQMFHNMKLVSENLHPKHADELIRGLSKYANKGVRTNGRDNSGAWVRYMAHGRRMELDYAADQITKGNLYSANRNIKLTHNNGKYIANSDYDGIEDNFVLSLKRQGSTLDDWVGKKSDEWLTAWIVAATNTSQRNKVKFIVGHGAPSINTMQRLRALAAKTRNAPNIEYDIFDLLPPPSF